MDDIRPMAPFAALAVLLGCPAFFSITEMAMMASNRRRLQHLAGTVLVDSAAALHELIRVLGNDLPLDGPGMFNRLIVEHLCDIPEAGPGHRIGHVAMEILQAQDRKIKMVRLHRPDGE